MEKEHRAYKSHCLVLPYPSQGHINPLFQFSKLLDHKQIKVTLVTTRFTSKTMHRGSSGIELEAISDGYDEGGIDQAESIQAYIESFWKVGPETLAELLEKLSSSGCPVNCIVYDSVMPWALDVAKKFGIVGAAFFTQSCVVDSIYYHVNKGLLNLPLTDSEISLPGMPPLEPLDLPSFVYDFGSYPAFFEVVIGQFSTVDKADWVFCNTFYELEEQVVDWMAKFWPLRTIGPTIPSKYLDNQLDDDKDYGVDLFRSNNDACMKWLNEHPKNSVAYISFGSFAQLGLEEMEELAWGLRRSKSKFLWVVRESETAKVPKGFIEETAEKGLVVSWCCQLEVLAHEAVGCFITHCGWNSTLESLCLGVPLVAMPQWTDQSTNAKYIRDVWKIGVKAQPDEKGIVRREEVEHCISEIMEGERGKEIQKNAMKWKDLARKAVIQGGSSDKNIDEFIATLVKR
ncbi:putative UDP-glucuronosyl/UDP-glucosyltransferase [Rosa chinensis]|uniref:Glycosyltransferase n=1 Tax=Rosa chinensis TaxID=74649 RepID=A0A2P6PK17_ROSCH|nr:mogroside IE synthase [Rosa chinensis]XP_024167973.1 mogroside IE synthase [Rosa chinensis]XP_024167974.1 mogroside IE synthase [Rosa chinensis]PRQ22265.1 putative UDP-glucuronosyl/UDP-glucosyltransferase [Rosa chinensis]